MLLLPKIWTLKSPQRLCTEVRQMRWRTPVSKAKDCVKTMEEDPKCANCGGNHTANYTKCPFLQAELTKKQPIKPVKSYFPPISDQVTKTHLETPVTATSSTTYAAITSKTQSPLNDQKKTNIINQLTVLITNIVSDEIQLKNALLMILNLLPLLIN